MNIRYDSNGIPLIYCHGDEHCNDIEISDLVDRGKSGLHCRVCGAHLGTMSDLPEQYKQYVIRGV